jgi:hypothetical protein
MVHVFSTSLQNSVFDLMKCNCIVQFPDVGSRGHSPRRSGVDVNSVNQTFGNRCAYTTPQPGPLPAQPMYPYGNHHRAAAQNSMYAYPAHHHVQPAAVQVPAYSQSTAGLRVNLGQGAVITEARGIFIQGLSYSARDSDLASLLHNVGLRPVEFKVRKDSKGSSKGTATAKFGSKEEAQHGVKYLNGKLHMGKKLAVRLDLESTIVGHIDPVMVQRDPVIVDGTNRYGSGVSSAKPSVLGNSANDDLVVLSLPVHYSRAI